MSADANNNNNNNVSSVPAQGHEAPRPVTARAFDGQQRGEPRRLTTRRLAALAAIALAAVLVPLAVAASASAAFPYFVVVSGTAKYEQPPTFTTQVIPALPPGAYLSGSARCEQVYFPGGGFESPNSLDAGTYQFVTSSCFSKASDPLTLHGIAGEIRILGGSDGVEPDSTSVVTAGEEAEINTRERVVSLAAEVIDNPLDNSPIGGQTVTFYAENAEGLLDESCSAVTMLNGNGEAFATCVLTGKAAAHFEAGTGTYVANYAGGRDYLGSTALGQLHGETSKAQAAANLQARQNLEKATIHVTPTYVPPGCNPHKEDEEPVGLISVSLAELNCTQLKVLQVTTGVVLAVTSFDVDGEFGIASAIEDVATAAREARIVQLAKTIEFTPF